MLYVRYAQVFIKHKTALNNSFPWQRGWSVVIQGRKLRTWRFNFLTMRATQEGMSWLVKYWLPWPWNYATRGWISLCPVGVSCIGCRGGVGAGVVCGSPLQPHMLAVFPLGVCFFLFLSYNLEAHWLSLHTSLDARMIDITCNRFKLGQLSNSVCFKKNLNL